MLKANSEESLYPIVQISSRVHFTAPFLSFPQSLKKELDSLLEEKIRNPAPVDWQNRQSKDCAVISAIIDLITTQEKPTGGTKSYSRPWASAPRGPHIHFNDDDDEDDD